MIDCILVTTEDEYLAMRREWLSAGDLMVMKHISRRQASRIIKQVPEDLRALVVDRRHGMRRYAVIRTSARLESGKPRGNPRMHDTGFQQEMAFRRWRRPSQGTEMAQNASEMPSGWSIDGNGMIHIGQVLKRKEEPNGSL